MKLKKILCVLMLLFVIGTNYSHAGLFDKAKEFITVGESGGAGISVTTATSEFEKIAGLLYGIGIFLAVGVGIILGIKYMLASAEGKAEIAKILFPYLVGVGVIVAAVTIWKTAINILDVF